MTAAGCIFGPGHSEPISVCSVRWVPVTSYNKLSSNSTNTSTHQGAIIFARKELLSFQKIIENTCTVGRPFIPEGGRSPGFWITLLGQQRDTLILCSTHFKPNHTLYSVQSYKNRTLSVLAWAYASPGHSSKREEGSVHLWWQFLIFSVLLCLHKYCTTLRYWKEKELPKILVPSTNHPGLADIFAPNGVSGSDIMETSDNRRPIAGCKMVPKFGARWGTTICLPTFQSETFWWLFIEIGTIWSNLWCHFLWPHRVQKILLTQGEIFVNLQ